MPLADDGWYLDRPRFLRGDTAYYRLALRASNLATQPACTAPAAAYDTGARQAAVSAVIDAYPSTGTLSACVPNPEGTSRPWPAVVPCARVACSAPCRRPWRGRLSTAPACARPWAAPGVRATSGSAADAGRQAPDAPAIRGTRPVHYPCRGSPPRDVQGHR